MNSRSYMLLVVSLFSTVAYMLYFVVANCHIIFLMFTVFFVGIIRRQYSLLQSCYVMQFVYGVLDYLSKARKVLSKLK